MPDLRNPGLLRQALAIADVRLFLISSFVSNVGLWVQRVAVGWLVFDLTGSAGWVGAVAACELVPSLLVAPFGGVLSDRGDRFLLPDEPSWYELAYNASPTIEAVLDVNPSPDESQLKYTDPSELAARWNADKPQSRAFEPEVPRAEAAQAAIMRQRLWWWLLVAGVMALWAETVWLAGWRESSHINQATH